jgi:hypothetical protein
MRFGTWKIRSLYRSCSLSTVARELARYKLDLVGVQAVRWGKRGTVRTGDYIFLCGKGNETHQLGAAFFIHHKIVSAVKREEFVSDRTLYIVLRSRLSNIVVLMCMNEMRRKMIIKRQFLWGIRAVFEDFPKYHIKILLGDCNVKVCREDIFKPTVRNESLHQDSNDDGVRIVNFVTEKTSC